MSFHDLLTCQGTLDSWVHSLKLPFIMGSEVSGEVIGVGRNVLDIKVNEVRILKGRTLPSNVYFDSQVIG